MLGSSTRGSPMDGSPSFTGGPGAGDGGGGGGLGQRRRRWPGEPTDQFLDPHDGELREQSDQQCFQHGATPSIVHGGLPASWTTGRNGARRLQDAAMESS